MDTQPTEAVANDATAPVESTDELYARLGAEAFGDDTEEEQAPAEGEPEDGEAEGADDDLEIEEGDDETPPIEAPVSWDAEAKAKFAELPRDTQEYIAKREGERERFVQSKSQEATQAKQAALQQAHTELAQINAQYAQQLQQIADSVTAQEPDPALQLQDPIAYVQQLQAFKRSEAQRNQAQQTAAYHAQQAQAFAYQAEQAENAEQHRIIVEQFPEYADPTTGPKLRAELSSVAKDILGYPDELIQQARATDILAMRKVADLKAKADKYDALMSKKMSNVRAAKGLPRVATPGVSQGPEAVRSRNVSALKETLLTSKNRDVQGEAFMQLAKSQGWV